MHAERTSVFSGPLRQVLASSVVFLVCALAGWQVLSATVGPVPGASVALAAGGEWIASAIGRTAIRTTLVSAMLAFAISILGGVAIGVLLGVSPLLYRATYGMVLGAYAVPKLILFPIFFAIFQMGAGLYIAIAASTAIFPVIISVEAGIRERERLYDRLAASFNSSRWFWLRKIILPAMSLQLLSSIRIALSFSVLMVILVEMVASRTGVGSQVMIAYSSGRWPQMFGIIAVLFFCVIVLNMLIWSVEQGVKSRGG